MKGGESNSTTYNIRESLELSYALSHPVPVLYLSTNREAEWKDWSVSVIN
jgi:hypothetical protein